MRIKLDEGAFIPVREHKTDAGMDLKSREDTIIQPHGSAVFNTGVHIELPKNTCGLLVSKSGLYVNHGISSTGLIDEGYTGSILVKLVNHSDLFYRVSKGDKISQLIIIPCLYESVEIYDEITGSERGSNGFGSTGK